MRIDPPQPRPDASDVPRKCTHTQGQAQARQEKGEGLEEGDPCDSSSRSRSSKGTSSFLLLSMQRRLAAAAQRMAGRLLLLLPLLLALLAGGAEAKRTRGRHHTVEAPSTAGVVGAAMGHLEAMGEIEDETSRLQSRWKVHCRTHPRPSPHLPSLNHPPTHASTPTVQIPRELFRPEGYSHKEALFGIPVYGGTIAERLFYANTTKMCSAPTAEEVRRRKSSVLNGLLFITSSGMGGGRGGTRRPARGAEQHHRPKTPHSSSDHASLPQMNG